MVVCPACGPPFPSPSAWLTTLRRIASKSVSTGISDAFGSSLDGGSVCVEYTGFGISREWTGEFDSRRASVPVRSRYCPCSFTYRRTGEIQRVLQWSCPFYDSMFTIDCAWLAIVNRPGRRLLFRVSAYKFFLQEPGYTVSKRRLLPIVFYVTQDCTEHAVRSIYPPSIHYITDNLRVTHSSPIQPSRFFLSPQGSAKPVRHETS